MAGQIPVWRINAADGPSELPPSRWAEFKKVAGVLVADVPLDGRSSFYARWGDWLPAGCWLLIGVAMLWPTARRKSADHG